MLAVADTSPFIAFLKIAHVDIITNMNNAFQRHIEALPGLFDELMKMLPVKARMVRKPMPACGVYLFSEGSNHIYVGRTDRMQERLREHCRKGSTHFSASFAFLLAKDDPTCAEIKGPRAVLEKHEVFGEVFRKAKARVSEMDIRFVRVDDPYQQALLEIYVSVALTGR